MIKINGCLGVYSWKNKVPGALAGTQQAEIVLNFFIAPEKFRSWRSNKLKLHEKTIL